LAVASAASAILLAAACAVAGDAGKVAGRLDGSRDVYLSLSDASRSTAGWGTPRDGASVTGAPLRIGSVTFERGIGTHAPAELVFPVGGRYRWLTTYAGVSEEMTEAGSITVQVWLDGKKVHETPVMRVKEEPLYIALPLGGAKEVRIVGTDAGNGIGADHVCLGNLRLCVGEKEPAPDGPKPTTPLVISPLRNLAGHIPERGVASTEPAKRWEFALVSGNGRLGAMVFGHPTKETIIANHCRLFLPLGSREIVPDLAKHVPELRKIIREQGYGKAMDFFLGKAREQGFPGLIWTDPFHPGFFLTIRMPHEGEIRDYARTQDFATGEVAVRWRDDAGAWQRRLFVSRTDNVVALSISGPGPGKAACTLTPELVGEKRILSERKVENGWVTYHNVYQHGKGGYDAVLRVVPRGGEIDSEGEAIQIAGADEVLVLMRIVPWKTPLPEGRSEAWAYSPENPDFAADRLGKYAPAPPLADSSVVAYRAPEDARALLPKLKDTLTALPADYAKLFEPHAKAHGELFHRVTLDLAGGGDREKGAEELLDAAAKEKRLSAALLEKMYDAGRYMFICSAGELPPNLQGIWTGTWAPAWSGDFTLDTNLQLALKHGLSGNLPELMEGHYRLIESFIPDWRLNARRIYGCRGVLSNARASNNCLLLHWGGWQGVFWTAGAGWLSHFFHDQYRYTEDHDFLARRVVPLLKEVVAFYEDFLLVNAATGLYEFIPSYSPESSTGITATMDVMVAREALASLVEACETLGIEGANMPRWKGMLAKLPPYRINKDGALAEFVPDGYGEWYRHRHLSHLHAAYEATGELTPEGTPEVWKAAQEATRRRINADGEQSSHGHAHMGLAAAHLRLAEEAYGRVAIMAIRRSMYPSLMCSHEPNQQIFNVDANGAIPEIVNRMLVSSQPGLLDLLPALPAAMPKGAIRGILARGQIRLGSLEWDAAARRILLQLTSGKDQSLALRLPPATSIRVTRAEKAEVRPSTLGANAVTLVLRKGQPATVEVSQ
jgi:hypothetical protein